MNNRLEAMETRSHEGDKVLTRREMLGWLGKRTLETALFVGSVNVVGLIAGDALSQKRDQAQAQSEKAIEAGNSLQVKYFAGEIYSSSKEITGSLPQPFILEEMTGAFLGNAVISYLFKGRSETFNKYVGMFCANGGRLVDIVSTEMFAKYMADPRFKEYGLDAYSAEQSPVLPNNPTPDDVERVNFIIQPIISIIGYVSPYVGRIYLGMSPVIAHNNIYGAHVIKTSLDLGDKVKGLISKGIGADGINEFLRGEVSKVQASYTPNASNHAAE
jgi:hypothetical protein